MAHSKDAANYIRENFKPEDRLAVVLVNKQNDAVYSESRAPKVSPAEEFQRWLRHMNASAHEVYVSMNSLQPGARGRTKADVDQIRHVYLDLDEAGPDALKKILDRQDLPKPNYVLNTSPGKYQVVWKAEGFTKDQAEDLQRGLARETGADIAATDCARVLRLPGLYNHKYGRPHYVRAEKISEEIATPDRFPARQEEDAHVSPSTRAYPERSASSGNGAITQSERDWAYAKRALSRGIPKEQIIEDIMNFRQDKPNPALLRRTHRLQSGGSITGTARRIGYSAGTIKGNHGGERNGCETCRGIAAAGISGALVAGGPERPGLVRSGMVRSQTRPPRFRDTPPRLGT